MLDADAADAEPGVDPRRLRDELYGCRLARRVVHRTSVTSTNAVAREIGRSGADSGVLVVADEQTAGRGRRGRSWESPRGRGLYCSVVMPGAAAIEEYSVAVQLGAGVAVAEALASHGVRTQLDWPNDCYCEGRKVAGVLVEAEGSGSELDFLVCGIGVNVNQRAGDFDAALRDRATSLRELLGTPVDLTALLAALVRSLESWDEVARNVGIAPIVERWQALTFAQRGMPLTVETTAGILRGHDAGLSPRGGLLLEVDGARRELRVGEVVRTRRAP